MSTALQFPSSSSNAYSAANTIAAQVSFSSDIIVHSLIFLPAGTLNMQMAARIYNAAGTLIASGPSALYQHGTVATLPLSADTKLTAGTTYRLGFYSSNNAGSSTLYTTTATSATAGGVTMTEQGNTLRAQSDANPTNPNTLILAMGVNFDLPASLGSVIVGGVKKPVSAMSVIVGGVKKPVAAASVIVGGVKKPLA